MNKDEIKHALTITHIDQLLTGLGSDFHGGGSKGRIYTTVCHCGDSHKLYYYPESQSFYCYTHCGAMDIYGLIQQAMKSKGIAYGFIESVRYVANMFDFSFDDSGGMLEGFGAEDHESELEDIEWMSKFFKKKDEDKITLLSEIPSESMLRLSKIHHPLWLKEGISEQTMEKYGIMYDFKSGRIMIPHYDINSRLVGVRGRSTSETIFNKEAKYFPLIRGKKALKHDVGKNLYGLHKTKEAIKRLKKVVIWEGEKSVLKCDSFYGDNNFTVATCGKVISDYQRDLLLSLGIEEVIIGYDKQYIDSFGCMTEEKQDYADYLKRIARKFTPYVNVTVLWDNKNYLKYKDAPVDNGKAVLEMLMKEKITITDKDYSLIREKNKI